MSAADLDLDVEAILDQGALAMVRSEIERHPVYYALVREEVDTRPSGTRGRILRAPLSDLALRSLVRALEILADGGDPVVLDGERMVTTTRAAQILGVSRPTVVAMCDRGDLPCSLIGPHRRLRLADLLRRK